MIKPAFVHLRLHSEFSITDGIVRVDEGVARAAADGMPALALSDLSNVFGAVKFYKACRRAGVKPIIAADVWLQNTENREQPFRLLLLCRHHAGYLRLCDLLSRAYRENRYRERAELCLEWLAEGDNSGLIALSGAQHGEIGQALRRMESRSKVGAILQRYQQCFPDAFYLEVQRIGEGKAGEEVEAIVQATLKLATHTNTPVVATHPIQFLASEDFKAHEARVCIAEGGMIADKRRISLFTKEHYFLSTAEMQAKFADIPAALANSVEIAKRCNLEIQLGKSFLPSFPTPNGMTLDDFLVQRAKEGLVLRLQKLFPNEAERLAQHATYQARLKFETDTIIQMGFPGYFLIVADFINWAKQNGVPVGPGRGSGAGSLVAYSLGITDIDPLSYALLFERFLNPERVSMPDFDIDFCQDNRWRVIEYVRERYGTEAVSQIVTFGTMAAKAVIRDVGRVLDLPYSFCDGLSKLIPAAPGKQYSLTDALEMEPILQQRLDNEEEVANLFELARKLEGITRNVGMHAGGVLIAKGKITDFCPVYLASGEDASPVSQFDKDDVEAVGLVKFDFLGLRNLTIIDLALKYILKLDPRCVIDLETLPRDDPAAYQIYKDANTTAIFQVESDGMKKLLAKLQADRFEDIIAVLALYRPGPLNSGMVDDFILRKKGQSAIDYFHPDLEACLSPTYGVIVYQEQVMQISQIIGGYTLGAADMLRRAMGKKKPEEMAQQRQIFTDGALKKGHTLALAERLFDLMAMFAEYGFNKSHTAAYALVSYQTAWLKAHHTAAFMAATLSSELDNTDQLKVFFDDCIKNKLQILPPDINLSNYAFEPVSRVAIRYGLGAIKGTGEPAINEVRRVREADGDFTSLFDFCMRVDKRSVNRRAIEALIRAGAFDSLHPNRAAVLASVDRALELAEQTRNNAHQGSLFDLLESETPVSVLEKVPEWDLREQLAQEKMAIGFFLSGHPFTAYQAEVQQLNLARQSLNRLQASKEPQWLAGVVIGVRIKMGRRGKMAFVSLEDEQGTQDVILYDEQLSLYKDKIKEDQLIFVRAKLSNDDYSGGFRATAEEVLSLTDARNRFTRQLCLRFDAGADEAIAQQLLQILSLHRSENGCPVYIDYQHAAALCQLRLSPAWRIDLNDAALHALRGLSLLSGTYSGLNLQM